MWTDFGYYRDIKDYPLSSYQMPVDTLGSGISYCVIGFLSLQPYVFSQNCIKVVKFTMQVAAVMSCLLLMQVV
jgi:hypothetical protein